MVCNMSWQNLNILKFLSVKFQKHLSSRLYVNFVCVSHLSTRVYNSNSSLVAYNQIFAHIFNLRLKVIEASTLEHSQPRVIKALRKFSLRGLEQETEQQYLGTAKNLSIVKSSSPCIKETLPQRTKKFVKKKDFEMLKWLFKNQKNIFWHWWRPHTWHYWRPHICTSNSSPKAVGNQSRIFENVKKNWDYKCSRHRKAVEFLRLRGKLQRQI